MGVVGSILTMLIMLSILVVIHEWGHYIVARLFKVKVDEFSIFMGPKLFQRVGKKTGTKFSIRALPIGGYCAMHDEDGSEGDPDDSEGSFYRKPKRVRAAVFVAGPLMNILLGFLLVVIVFSIVGYSTNTIGRMEPGGLLDSYVDTADPGFRIEAGDRLVSYDGYAVNNATEYSMFKGMDRDYISVIKIRKPDGRVRELTVDRTPDKEGEGMKLLGFSFEYVEHPGVFGVIGEAFIYLGTLVRMILYSIFWLITGRVGLEAVSGPVGITAVVSDVITAEASIWDKVLTLVNMAALISVNLGIFNLLPFPGLDGGQLTLVGVEAITGGKRIPKEKQGLISFIGIAVLIVLAVVIMGKDIWQLITGSLPGR